LAGKKEYQREPLELTALAQEAFELYIPKAESRGFQIHADYPSEPIPITGDAKAIIQAILNLLDNAVKYSGDSRSIELNVYQTASDGRVSVADQGVGIAPQNWEKIFEKFYRIPDKRSGRVESGVGLGLAMVKHVMDGHQGNLILESDVGERSVFTLVFP